jgi:hypothetical protein
MDITKWTVPGRRGFLATTPSSSRLSSWTLPWPATTRLRAGRPIWMKPLVGVGLGDGTLKAKLFASVAGELGGARCVVLMTLRVGELFSLRDELFLKGDLPGILSSACDNYRMTFFDNVFFWE